MSSNETAKTAAEYGRVKYTEYYRKMRSMSNLISLTEMRYFQENFTNVSQCIPQHGLDSALNRVTATET